ncbi:hypothetical protein GF314_03270 [bacterium]|nr:hypothetical protein [bacterium]
MTSRPSPSRRRDHAFAALVVLVALVACAPDSRDPQLDALARWEDRRLAPPDSLGALISGDDAHVRRTALRTAGRIGRTDVLPAMIAALDDRSQAVRAQAAFSLGLLGGDVAVAPLTRALDDPHLATRVAACEGLAHQEHDGSMLYRPALDGKTREAIAAWNALRNVAARADRDSLVAAIRAGLTRPENEVRWRVLRCAERAPDSTLVAQIAPYAIDRDVQVRVHALRALRRHHGRAAVEAVLRSSERRGRLHGHELRRVRVAELRALGAVAGPFLAADREGDHTSLAGRIASILAAGASASDPQVVASALAAMAAATADLPLPPQAVRQESLLPVWRLRLVRQARARLGDPSFAVRASAVLALGRLRGAGARSDLRRMLDDPEPPVVGAALTALVRFGPDARDLARYRVGRSLAPPAEVALLSALADLDSLAARPELAGAAFGELEAAIASDDFTVRTAACGLAAELPSGYTLAMLHWSYRDANDLREGMADVQLAAIGGIEAVLAAIAEDRTFAPDTVVTRRLGLPTTGVGSPGDDEPGGDDGPFASPLFRPGVDDTHRGAVADLLQRAFDHPDLRVRLAARACALATAVLPEALIPAEASLRETLPPVRRAYAQPPVRAGFHAPDVRVITDEGTFTIRLDGEIAPNTCLTFLHLVRSGFHEGLTLHRVVPDFVIQGGCPRGDGWGGPGWTIRSEWSRRPFRRGTLGIAHGGKDTGGSQWFVCHSAQPHLNGRYTVFGEVVDGMDVVDRIERGDRYRIEIVQP